jgi:2-octaprenyl-6-methoxyphenol hydroxylase
MGNRRDPACIVVGTGPAGLAASLALAAVGAEVTLLGPPPAPPEADTRTAALFASSLAFLRNVGGWDAAAARAEPLTAIRVVDDTGRLLRSPEVLFRAEDVGLEALGANVPNAGLVAALWSAVRRHPRIVVQETRAVVSVRLDAAGARLLTAEGQEFAAPLLAAADGRNSLCRRAAGIATRTWDYDQAAIAATFHHSRPHHGISTEFHRPAGPLTTVPMPGQASSLVWVERTAVARRLMDMDDGQFAEALAARLQGLLGRIGPAGPRRLFPLTAMLAERFGRNRVALIGEAGHVMTPVGAQGLNLSLRDAAALAQCWARIRPRGRGSDPQGLIPRQPTTNGTNGVRPCGSDPVTTSGSAPLPREGLAAEDIERLLARYEEMRRSDIASRSFAVDTLNRTLISELLPVSLLRGLGLHALKAMAPLRRALMRQGLEGGRPRLALLEPDGGGLMVEGGQ